MTLKEEIIRKLIKDKNFADELCNFPVRNEDMMQLVCHAPISLFEKRDLYKRLAENSPECNDKPYRNRMLIFAKRIKRCYELNVPDFFLIAQKCMFIDSVLLYTTNAVGEFVVNKK